MSLMIIGDPSQWLPPVIHKMFIIFLEMLRKQITYHFIHLLCFIEYPLCTYLPWFIDLTFQVPMQNCPLQHRTLLPSPVTSTTGYCVCFDSISSFFLELYLHWCPVAYWAPTDLESSSFSVLSFCLFILFTGFSRQEYRSGLPFPSPVDHIL